MVGGGVLTAVAHTLATGGMHIRKSLLARGKASHEYFLVEEIEEDTQPTGPECYTLLREEM